MIRVVLDTNIVVSAMLRQDTLPEAVFNLAIDGKVQLCISEPVLAEYEEVLRRPRLGIDPKKVGFALAQIREAAQLVVPTKTVTAAHDADDNIARMRRGRPCRLPRDWQPTPFSRSMEEDTDHRCA